MKTRVITAIVAILLFFPFVIIGDWPFYLVMLLISTVGLYELFKMREMNKYLVPTVFAMILLWVLLLPAIDALAMIKLAQQEILSGLVMLILGYTVLVKNKFTFEDAGFMIITAIYIGLGFHYFIEAQRTGLEYIFYAIIVILATDIGAYFSGRYFGKRKLWPEISPNKTIEGALGGIILATVLGVIFHLIFPVHNSLLIVGLVSMLASAVGQVGDLVESAFKRYYHVKDSGRLLPGHGGILDRFDSWLFVFPFLYLIQFIA
ncbi:phosphatidate cytidylyltransferase [Halolactibacillus alkaliphilus]|uniref:Phosphatidate cytidylyltransferase n=1 Tax=Halolactibacillus alkaliphilus TaxID=442899 RepID=A0A511WYT6_9BACI|nr:phosphatidate cytidylyltransferase [Halolactibacillus alkaliphilus]GEN55811.1 phosphatidate cytidylyltransferase [Halolactibacillus alkaliphilus]GGN64839.1 phosphatidate cytidylyltransferase [Halolactibacillus alkaliphilus]SFO64891.1 phosphatidate cytidylyltransferase [Halolactibacillus alkaliphilus]